MNTKIIISESQYETLIKFINEHQNLTDVLKFIKPNDELVFTVKNKEIKIKILSVMSGEILGITGDNSKVKFTNNSYDDKTGVFNFQIAKKDDNKFLNDRADVSGLQVVRNGEVVDVIALNNDKKNTISKEPQNNEPISIPDNPSDEVDLDANVPDTPELRQKKQREKGEKALRQILTDPVLRKAFYRQPTFWELFTSELSGKKPVGKGIGPALDLIDKYNKKLKLTKIKGDFVKRRTADFKIGKRIDVQIMKHGKLFDFVLDGNELYDAVVQNYERHGLTVLTGRNKNNIKYKIIVKDATKNPNVYICDYEVVGDDNITNTIPDILTTFYTSAGFPNDKSIK